MARGRRRIKSLPVLDSLSPRDRSVLEEWVKNVFDANSGDPVPHAEYHLRTGKDPLAAPTSTPLPVTVGGTGAIGAGPSFITEGSRFGIPVGTPVAVGLANDAGSGGNSVHANHVHDTGLRDPGDLMSTDGVVVVIIPGLGIPDGYVLVRDAAQAGGAAYVDPSIFGSSASWVPLTTVIGGVPELVWDIDNQLIMTSVEL